MGYERRYNWLLSCDFCKKHFNRDRYNTVIFTQEELDQFRGAVKANLQVDSRPIPEDFNHGTVMDLLEQKVQDIGWHLIGEAVACNECKGKL